MEKAVFIFALIGMIPLSCSKKETSTVSDENAVRNAEMAAENQGKSPKLSITEEGKSLVYGADCSSCHQSTERLIGPSYQEIAGKYSEKDIDYLAEKIVNGGSGVWGATPMAAHPGLSKENAQKMVQYILTQRK